MSITRRTALGVFAAAIPEIAKGPFDGTVGDWYARRIHIKDSPQYKYHVQTYGHASKFGDKDICRLWKVDPFNADHLVQPYSKAGATRPWKVSGNAPAVAAGEGFNERNRKDLTANDVPFTSRNGAHYVLVMGWPAIALKIAGA